ncbi:hypothetical protein ACIQWN_29180 [Streptomyces vinaceus]
MTQSPAVRAGQSLALPGSDLFETVRRKLINDLGATRAGGALAF